MGINIITEPSVYLIGSSTFNPGTGQFLRDHDIPNWETDTEVDSEYLVEMAGRLCYMSFAKPRPGGNKAYIGHLLEVGHGSVLEHAIFNFIFTGVSRSLTHELVRHRAGMSYSQLSQRYVDESDVAFVVPPALLGPVSRTMEVLNSRPAPHTGEVYLDRDSWWVDDREIGHQWLEACEYARRKYIRLIEWLTGQPSDVDDRTARRKMARESARSVLPNCTETKIFVTANARALRHFVEMRANPAADAEIRRLAIALLRVLQIEAPNIFSDYVIEPCPLGGEQATTPHRKV